ncbi:OLC1v1028905C2 [Oldenlandia corymbosa var. corymbosa]|uniref:OLC1v1028905C2 n=1 Tax=Oldenlandia corymbosa var. corymbosa TaxID=529605 RepID=A0AAV1CD05_OLDCO|nr:OLC1v1028905C2 [Oldenlandia corymbosa var. corymbosa]
MVFALCRGFRISTTVPPLRGGRRPSRRWPETREAVALLLFLLLLMIDLFPSLADGRRKGGWIFTVFAEAGGGGGGGGGFWGSSSIPASNVGIAIVVTAMAGLALAATVVYSRRGSLKSPWSRRRRKHALLPKQWKTYFDAEGRLIDGGVKFLKKARSGGVDPSIRAEVWPFLLGVYDLKSTKEERDSINSQKRKEYESLRRQCQELLRNSEESSKSEESGIYGNEDSGDVTQVLHSPGPEDVVSAQNSDSDKEVGPRDKEGKVKTDDGLLEKDNTLLDQVSKSGITTENSCEPETGEEVVSPRNPDSVEEVGPTDEEGNENINNAGLETDNTLLNQDNKSGITTENAYQPETESSDSDSSEEPDETQPFIPREGTESNDLNEVSESDRPRSDGNLRSSTSEDFNTWQRIIRVDAIRANGEWVIYSPSQASVSEIKARELAESVGLKDYEHLEPCRIYHAARLVAILEAYALYDSEIGYCQGMSDLLSPIIAVMEEDHEAFWCFVGFMQKARHNFRLDEVGIRRQLNMVSKIIKSKDSHLYRHLEKLQAEDCFFVYRMVVVLFRRELDFDQTLCLWEVMWADQAAIRAGIAKSTWGRLRLRAPPTEDLLLYAIAACVLQRRKLIIEKYCSMDEIMRECNSMAGHLDVWKLLDDAHDLVVTLHDKI